MQAFAGEFPADSYKIVFLGYKTTNKNDAMRFRIGHWL